MISSNLSATEVFSKADQVRLSYANDSSLIAKEMASLVALGQTRIDLQLPVGATIAQLRTGRTESGLAAWDALADRLHDILPAGYSWNLPPQSRFLTSQKWEGTVISVGEETFFARLRDLTDRVTKDEDEAELPTRDVSPDDMELFKTGAQFYFSVGYRISEYGNYERSSRIRFRRLPRWSPNEVISAFERAKAIVKRFLIE